jgi:hypothetical protein
MEGQTDGRRGLARSWQSLKVWRIVPVVAA